MRIGQILSLVVCVVIVLTAGGRAAVESAVPVRMVPPEFPYELKRAGISGVVTLSFEVDEHGAVQNAQVQKSSRVEFERAALEAIRKWKFKPGRRDGVPITMKIQLPMRFDVNE